MSNTLPVGKLPNKLLHDILPDSADQNESVIQGPGIGLDCAVIDNGDNCLVYKSDPITFAADEIGWYLVHINANDIATTGAQPKWLLLTMLLPEHRTSEDLVREISQEVQNTCDEIGAEIIGGHTEITTGLNRPILIGTMVGEVEKEKLVFPGGARSGDRVLLTKGVPIEGTAVLAREFPEKLDEVLDAAELNQAQNYLYNPGISVLKDAQIATAAGAVHAMHDPTEGGLQAALWELAIASECRINVNTESVPVSRISTRVCQAFEINPLALIASGSLLLTASPKEADKIRAALEDESI
ncbi:MAG: AIR synthase, partial [Candidatus Marinimicrobia bacterium]|nr:AIR synthase [Candidatus Neomarinimicrobiota bacterium]